MEGTMFTPALEGMKHVKSEDGVMLTKPFLDVCKQILPKIAMKLAPDRKKFMEVVGGTGDVNADMKKFCSAFSPFLEENHKFLTSVGMDGLKAS